MQQSKGRRATARERSADRGQQICTGVEDDEQKIWSRAARRDRASANLAEEQHKRGWARGGSLGGETRCNRTCGEPLGDWTRKRGVQAKGE
jgi:hypothetical protein